MSDSQYWLIKLLIAIPGAVVAWKSYQAFKRRQRDPSAARDPVTDRWWRIAMYAGGAVIADAFTIVATSAIGAPRWPDPRSSRSSPLPWPSLSSLPSRSDGAGRCIEYRPRAA